MAGATVPPEVLQDVSGCKLLASAFGFGLVQYDLVGCPSFSYINVFETFWKKWTPGFWMHSIPVFKRFNRSCFALDMTNACCVRRNFCMVRLPAGGKASYDPFRKKLVSSEGLSPQPAITKCRTVTCRDMQMKGENWQV